MASGNVKEVRDSDSEKEASSYNDEDDRNRCSGVSDDLRPWQRVLASSVGGLLTSLMTTPLDVVKIRLQAQAKPLAHGDCYIFSSGLTDHLCIHCGASTQPLCRPGLNLNQVYKSSWVGSSHNLRTKCFHSGSVCVTPTPRGGFGLPNYRTTGSSCHHSVPLQCLQLEGTQASSRALYKGSVDAAIQIVRHEGLTTLWSGLPPTLVIALPGTVIYYTLNDMIKEQLKFNLHAVGEEAAAQDWIPPVTGATARVAAVMILSPLELARTKVQSESLSYSFIFKSLRESVGKQGLRSMWLGAGPTLLRDVPFSAIYWYVFDTFKRKTLCRKLEARANGLPINEDEWVDGQPRLRFFESFLMGATAGCIAAVATLPFDVIKTHRQIELGESVFGNRRKPAPSTWTSIRNLYKARGARTLFTGIVPRLVKTMPACAIMISSFEYMKTYFARSNSLSG